MINFITLLSLFVIFVSIAFSRRHFGGFINPVALISVVFFVNNFSYSVTRLFYDSYESFIRFSEDAQIHGDLRNLAGYVVCVLMIFLTTRVEAVRNVLSAERVVSPKVVEMAYFIILGVVICISLLSKGGGGAYGEGQSLSAGDAFAPISILLMFRYFFIVISPALRMWLNMPVNYFFIGSSLFFELSLSVISGGRKIPFMIFITVVVLWVFRFSKKIRLSQFLMTSLVAVLMIFLSSITAISRGEIGSKGVVDRLIFAFENLGAIDDVFVAGINANNSQPLQYWVEDVWVSNGLEHLHGMSYLQAFVNLIVPRPFQGGLVDYQAAYVFKREAYANSTSMGYDFSFSAEAFLNFGQWFSWIPFLVYGYIIGIAYRSRNKSFLSFYLNVVLIGVAFAFFRTDSTALMRMFFLAFVPYFFLRMFFGFNIGSAVGGAPPRFKL